MCLDGANRVLPIAFSVVKQRQRSWAGSSRAVAIPLRVFAVAAQRNQFLSGGPARHDEFHNRFRGLIDDLRRENLLMHRTMPNR
jgi:hypothetical protein